MFVFKQLFFEVCSSIVSDAPNCDINYDRNMFIIQATGVFVPAKHFQTIIMLSSKA